MAVKIERYANGFRASFPGPGKTWKVRGDLATMLASVAHYYSYDPHDQSTCGLCRMIERERRAKTRRRA